MLIVIKCMQLFKILIKKHVFNTVPIMLASSAQLLHVAIRYHIEQHRYTTFLSLTESSVGQLCLVFQNFQVSSELFLHNLNSISFYNFRYILDLLAAPH